VPQDKIAAEIEDIYLAVRLGDDVHRQIVRRDSALSTLIAHAKGAAAGNLRPLIDADLNTPEGFKTALSAQAAIRRYEDLNAWISTTLEAADAAENILRDNDMPLAGQGETESHDDPRSADET
jgi:hypothetical protein